MADKNKKVIKTINTNNGKLTYETSDEYPDGAWYRNGKRFTKYVSDRYSFYDPKIGAYRKLKKEKPETELYTPYYDKLYNLAYRTKYKDYLNSDAQIIPFGDNHINLRTKGRMNLASLSRNMLDSIALNTGRTDTKIKDNLGLIGKETTFGGVSEAILKKQYKNRKNDSEYELFTKEPNISETLLDNYGLTNNHAYFTNKYDDYLNAITKKYNVMEQSDKIKADRAAKDAFENNRIKERTKHYHKNVMADAFARYADNPKKYNPGQGNYVQMVNNIGDEVFNEPQIQLWWNTEGKKYYNKGLEEKRRLSSAGKKSE